MPSERPNPSDRPTNPGDVAGGTYGHDKAEIARRSEAHKDKDEAKAEARPEPSLDDEPGARAT